MKYFKGVIKLLLFAMVLVVYAISSILIVAAHGFSFEKARKRLIKIVSLTGRMGLIIMGVEVIRKGPIVDVTKNFLIVSNHLSYVDILIISCLFPSCFVTSKEMRSTFFLGQLCLLGGCIFVDRKKRRNIHNEVLELTKSLGKGMNVAIFPEAASTNGDCVLRFRRPFFQAAIDSKIDILPVCLNYKSIEGMPITLKNRDLVFWYGDMSFFIHAFKLFSRKNIMVELSILPIVSTQDYSDKNLLADKCHLLIAENYQLLA